MEPLLRHDPVQGRGVRDAPTRPHRAEFAGGTKDRAERRTRTADAVPDRPAEAARVRGRLAETGEDSRG